MAPVGSRESLAAAINAGADSIYFGIESLNMRARSASTLNYSIKDFEIMAPVGSRESLAAAINAGADSIYFGIESLNMRARSASTFTIDDLREIAALCDEHGVKSYLTINTIIYDEDIELMRKIVDAAKEAGISAVIAADVSVMAYCNQVGQEVHLSTQLNISNAEALKFYSRFADVVVLARELNLKQVRKIYDAIQEQNITGPMGEKVRIEMFCHGALCMAVSGKCYLSLNELNASANRGACMQVCRRSYIVKDKESDIELEVDNQYIMSPKDLKTIHFMDEMIEAGVRGVKSYLTINTIIYDEDIELMRKIVDAAKEAGISAVIAADVSVMAYCNQVGQEVHLSTQLNISNAEALKFYSRFADVVVLARELNLKQVRKIYDAIQEQNITGPMGEKVRIEMFCHGALCMAVSGKCYLSLNELNASANRGACMQVCRRSYIVKDKESDIELEVDNQYIMSPKDLKTIHFMDEMIEAGVRVFKIEGRARGPEYVRTVVECYKEAIQT